MSDEVLVTGASSDIAVELARLVDPGLTLLGQCRNVQSLEGFRKAAPAREVVPVVGDLASREDVSRITEELLARVGRLVGVVHLAAPKLELKRFKDLDWTDVDRSLEIQVHSIGRVLQRLVPKMAKNGGGSIVLVLSSVTLTVPSFMSDYVIAKHALLGMMRSLSAEYVAKGVRVNAVSPSMTKTKFLSELPSQVPEATAERHPLKRHATPGEVASAIRFLLSPEASFVSGTNLAVTGGEAV
jgi:3-oxoacyl-[acyl-carrier protein] reductase